MNPQPSQQDESEVLGGGAWSVGAELFSDDFEGPLENWQAELQDGGTIEAAEGRLKIDVPGGCSLWWKSLLSGPVMIEYQATVIRAGGPNDRVSDLNCFWHMHDSRGHEFFEIPRSGRFEDYHQLVGYYVGCGGNTNTTTRFRRYIGDADSRPLLPEHDLREAKFMITPNQPMRIRCVAAGNRIEYWRDQERLFLFEDPDPCTDGFFAFRTVMSHLEIRGFRVFRLDPREGANESDGVAS